MTVGVAEFPPASHGGVPWRGLGAPVAPEALQFRLGDALSHFDNARIIRTPRRALDSSHNLIEPGDLRGGHLATLHSRDGLPPALRRINLTLVGVVTQDLRQAQQ